MALGIRANAQLLLRWFRAFVRANWKGIGVIGLATLIFFWPVLMRIGTYSEGGDAMFNAWTLARDHHCILRQNCPNFADGNIYFPNKDTMLYSETQLSVGLVSLPLRLISQNPILYNNVMTLVSHFLLGLGMYLLAKYLSRGKEFLPIMAGLIFEFSPYRMAAIWHLQNLSIFALPIVVLCILKYFRQPLKRYLWVLFAALLYVFFASWVQMVFVLMVLGFLLATFWLLKLAKPRAILVVGGVALVAILCTAPLIKQYIDFSKQNKASFGLADQLLYSSSLVDYLSPQPGTVLGSGLQKLHVPLKNFNLDSYSYMGWSLYAVGLLTIMAAYVRRKHTKDETVRYKMIVVFAFLALLGFVVSLGPLLKLLGNYSYGSLPNGSQLTIPLPWLLVDKLLPQLHFIRAIGRAAVIPLFVLCCFLGLFAYYLPAFVSSRRAKIITGVLCGLLALELLPAHLVPMSPLPFTRNWQIPKVYQFIKDNKQVDGILILNTDYDYKGAPLPVARAEQVLWAGYHNKNIFNGYSGYTPPNYTRDFEDFVDFDSQDIGQLKQLNVKYVLVDKELSATKPWVDSRVGSLLKTKVYSDSRYSLYSL